MKVRHQLTSQRGGVGSVEDEDEDEDAAEGEEANAMVGERGIVKVEGSGQALVGSRLIVPVAAVVESACCDAMAVSDAL